MLFTWTFFLNRFSPNASLLCNNIHKKLGMHLGHIRSHPNSFLSHIWGILGCGSSLWASSLSVIGWLDRNDTLVGVTPYPFICTWGPSHLNFFLCFYCNWIEYILQKGIILIFTISSSATYWRVELFDLEEVMANEGSKGIQGSSQIFVSLPSPICLLMPSVRTTPTANKLQHPHEARDPNFAWKKNPLLENMAISHWNCFCKIGTRV